MCDVNTGQCDCQPFVERRTCDSCINGYFNLTATGCSACNCSEFSISAQCSALGQCPCVQGIGGRRCDQCLPEYYNITTSGCTACNCSSIGVRSSSDTCDSVTGQCPCIGNTASRDCSQCPQGFFETNSPDTDACVECVCSMRSNVCRDDSASYQAAAVPSDFTQLCALDPVDCNDDWQLLTASGLSLEPFGPRYFISQTILPVLSSNLTSLLTPFLTTTTCVAHFSITSLTPSLLLPLPLSLSFTNV